MKSRRPAPGRTRANDPEGLRRRILDVAASAFQARGYHSTSTHDLVREAGVTSGAFHHHFRTKKDLGLAVIRERVARAVEQTWIEPVKLASNALDGISDVLARIAAGLDSARRVQGCPLNNLATELSLADSELRIAMQEIYDEWRETIAAKLRGDRASGALDPDVDPEDLATFVVASYSGSIALAKSLQDPAPLRLCARQLAIMMQKQAPRDHGGRRRRT